MTELAEHDVSPRDPSQELVRQISEKRREDAHEGT